MAIKIDLLPSYVKWRKRLKYTIATAIVGLSLWTGGLLLFLHSKQLELETAKTNSEAIKLVAGKAKSADDATTAATNAAASYNAANNFMLASCKTGSERAALLNLITKYIDENSVVKTIDISDGKNVTIIATVTTPDEYAQFLLNLRKATGVVFAGDPRLTTSGVGGFGNGAQTLVVPQPDPGSPPVLVNYPITLTAQGALLNTIVLPIDPVAPAASAGAAGAGARPVTPGAPPAAAAPPTR